MNPIFDSEFVLKKGINSDIHYKMTIFTTGDFRLYITNKSHDSNEYPIHNVENYSEISESIYNSICI
ncbi:hypothetical protein M2325_000661 [Methanococcus voltae PS]|uniref:Uncharacterized protein n=1 Tax=Methanococcus voltae PS TaxID=523842 RepID=A0ABT2EVJ4_METVO|nr:hypothetical protein [Methanococcus voltae]MCS3921976.1 hypothetical protein [Methanococcus voltae PS]